MRLSARVFGGFDPEAASVTESLKKLLLVPGADHGMSYALARKRYQEMLYAFVEKYINKNEE